jgi:hypothetical protein
MQQYLQIQFSDSSVSLMQLYLNRGMVWIFYVCSLFNNASSAAPQIPLVTEDAGIEPRTVASLALDIRRSSRSATSHKIIFDVDIFNALLGSIAN